MPETKTEWLCFVLGLVVIAVLVYAIVQTRASDGARHPGATVSHPASLA